MTVSLAFPRKEASCLGLSPRRNMAENPKVGVWVPYTPNRVPKSRFPFVGPFFVMAPDIKEGSLYSPVNHHFTKKEGVCKLAQGAMSKTTERGNLSYACHLAMGQNPVPPVHIPIPTKIGSKVGGEFTYQPKWDPKTSHVVLFANHLDNATSDKSPSVCQARCAITIGQCLRETGCPAFP